MKRLGLILLFLSLLLLLNCSAEAGGCYQPRYYPKPYYPPYQYYEPVYIAVPQLTVVFNPGPVSEDPQLIELRALRAENERLRNGGAVRPGTMPPADEPQAKQDLTGSASRSNCASCHDAKVAADRAKGNVFFDGGRLVATPAQRLRMMDAILADKDGNVRMPPKEAMSPEESAKVFVELVKAK